jgi:hypothetical protein
MKKYFFRINWSLMKGDLEVEKGILNYTSLFLKMLVMTSETA